VSGRKCEQLSAGGIPLNRQKNNFNWLTIQIFANNGVRASVNDHDFGQELIFLATVSKT
jgi:hypothetical protein